MLGQLCALIETPGAETLILAKNCVRDLDSGPTTPYSRGSASCGRCMQGARSRDERPPRSGSCCGPRLGNVRCAPNNGPWQHLSRKSQLSHFRTHAPQDVPSFGQPQRDPSGSTHLATHFARTLPHIRAPEPLPFSVAEERLRTDTSMLFLRRLSPLARPRAPRRGSAPSDRSPHVFFLAPWPATSASPRWHSG